MDKIKIIPRNRKRTNGIGEKNNTFLCPTNTVMTGRCHDGDENGKTWYEYAELSAFDENGTFIQTAISVVDIKWSEGIIESSGQAFYTTGDRVIVGRKHNGDEKGKTYYATGIVKVAGYSAKLSDVEISPEQKESNNKWNVSPHSKVMIGRCHKGDENGKTYHVYATLYVQTVKPTAYAPQGTILIPAYRTKSIPQEESANDFLCKGNTVLTGMYHKGDENGETIYEYSTLKPNFPYGKSVDYEITVENIIWTDPIDEGTDTGRYYDAPFGKVIVGRRHINDEKGTTQYAIGDVFFNGHPTTIKNYHISEQIKESNGTWFKTNSLCVITGRHHYGDENGKTYYGLGTISCDTEKETEEELIVHIKLHSEEKWFPMNPKDFLRLSRVRRHNDRESDDGYNKDARSFVNGDYHTEEYYDIPELTIKDFHAKGEYEMMNLRTYDDNSQKKDELFLQPDYHLYGDNNPNKRVAVFKEKYGNCIKYWLFFGYDEAHFVHVISSGHQGDWECLTIYLDNNNRINTAILSQHNTSKKYSASELEIIHGEKEELTIYCAKGSHALFNKVGKYSHKVFLFLNANDYTNADGYKWTITDNVIPLNDNTLYWKFFTGAWGEIGTEPWTTGPLGPWYKSDLYFQDVKKHNSPSITELINEKQLLIVIGAINSTIKEVKESSGEEVRAPQNNILYTRVHKRTNSNGDENDITEYRFAELKAIDINGNAVNANITIEDLKWSDYHKQNDSENFFMASDIGGEHSDSRVLTGRQHEGNEMGDTRYLTGVIKCNGKYAKVTHYPNADLYVWENTGKKVEPKKNLVIIGIKHQGDENEKTMYCQGYITVEI